MYAFFQGFSLCMSLILAIGAQNAFVLKQGLRGEHVFAVCAVCALSDALLIAVGVYGFHMVVERQSWIVQVAHFGGAAFLFFYGALSFRAALGSGRALVPGTSGHAALAKVLSACLALTWLNPHVYLDTVVLIGMVSTQFPGRSAHFLAGASSASLVFFFSLGYGARLLKPLFAKPAAWRWLDAFVGVVMWSIGLGLLL